MKDKVNGLFWFRNDLRLDDNPALNSLCSSCDQLTFVYILDPELLEKGRFGTTRLGSSRWKFIEESLADLTKQLSKKNQQLIIKYGTPTEIIPPLIQQHDIEHIGFTFYSGYYETQDILSLKDKINDSITWHSGESHTLFNQTQLPFEIDELPDGFSPFRRSIEKALNPSQIVEKVVVQPSHFPEKIKQIESDKLPSISSFINSIEDMHQQGGEQAAIQQIAFYTHKSQCISEYKETRNGLDGWNFSSKLSAYLAHGCISPRQVMQYVVDYENQNGANDSTYWLYFELLWREFYQWHQARYQSKLYLKRGIQDIDPKLTFDEKAYKQWQYGNTENDFVNAFMIQLKLTGWMSNRGRQIVASYFVNQLNLDWRYGAAWFEEQLIDYDAGSNWGNWQYLAGVGVDPRGRRAFNIEKQRKMYDPENMFIDKYLNQH